MKLISKLPILAAAALLSLTMQNSAMAQGANVWDGVYTEVQAVRGEKLYQERCSACHGSQMQGIEEAPGLIQGAFVYNWDGMPVSILFQRLRETMPLDDPKGTSRKIKADILAFIMSENSMPAGTRPLPYQNSQLKKIQWNAQKPAE
ncbi:MAG: c-type cytochrome [Kordiimonadaceae bacterium]|jgi:cytochrome c|nr:c-type cytochrome [Kordiimonadaceae bacterium]